MATPNNNKTDNEPEVSAQIHGLDKASPFNVSEGCIIRPSLDYGNQRPGEFELIHVEHTARVRDRLRKKHHKPVKKRSKRQKLHYFLHYDNGFWAILYRVINGLAILGSITTLIFNTEPQYWNQIVIGLIITEAICVGIFVIDFILRFIARRTVWWRWLVTFSSIIDYFSIFPFVIEMIIVSISSTGFITPGQTAALGVLRVFRALRILKLGLYTDIVPTVGQALRASIPGFVLLLEIVAILMLIFSTAMFYAEQTMSYFDASNTTWIRPDGASPFQSIAGTFWWSVVTVTTVGYGDSVPISPLGKAVACIAAVAGILLFAFPISVFSENFSDAFKQYRSRKQRKQVKDFIKGKTADFKDQTKLMKEALVQCSDLEVMLEDMQQQLKESKAKHEMLSTLIARVISLQQHGVDEKAGFEEEHDDKEHHSDDDNDSDDDADEEEESKESEEEGKSGEARYVQKGDEESGMSSSSSTGISIPQRDGDIRSADVSKRI
eukprot:TRINITY_DN6381_c0_g1_i1.p1 TRINITY_DN6381_c0_g1~~TRINITY_DN6381_c0_g1_i1.p1  ORF type:complete len:494 (+),score=53.25 TRINITY_DN6381_c0_g1_i1:34-1515(+)